MITERRHIRFLLAACGVLALLYAASFALNRRIAPVTAGSIGVFGAFIYLSVI